MATGRHEKGEKGEEKVVTRDDLEAGLRSVVGEVEHRAESTARRLVPVAIGGGLLVILLAYLIGKRVGTTKSTVVEIRRI